MPRYAHRTGGSGEITYTTSPIYQYGVETGNPLPPMTDKFPADRVTRQLQKPKGEKPRRYNDALAPRGDSGAHFITGAGPTAAPGVNAPRGGLALDRGAKQQIPNRDRFSQETGRIGGGAVSAEGRFGPAKTDRGTPIIDSKGRRSYMGRSG
jgi:hypothetical protein